MLTSSPSDPPTDPTHSRPRDLHSCASLHALRTIDIAHAASTRGPFPLIRTQLRNKRLPPTLQSAKSSRPACKTHLRTPPMHSDSLSYYKWQLLWSTDMHASNTRDHPAEPILPPRASSFHPTHLLQWLLQHQETLHARDPPMILHDVVATSFPTACITALTPLPSKLDKQSITWANHPRSHSSLMSLHAL